MATNQPDRQKVDSFAHASGVTGDLLQLVSFKVGDEEFGLDILTVQEIIRNQELTRVPKLPAFIRGVINLRGTVIPVIGLRRLLKLEDREEDKQTRIVVVEVGGTVIGFIVDSVSEVLRIPTSTVEPPPRLAEVENDFVSGVGKLEGRLLLLLDLDRLICESERRACSDAAAA